MVPGEPETASALSPFATPAAMNFGSGLRFSPQFNVISPRKREEFPWPMPNAPVARSD
ncbi:hypothetical protein RHEC894_CH00502 [Rhizobium sp. CIAT894]|nr:hypothetical protein RHEC894_CH00502 [Rhizobium sp. CIAT894]